MGDGHPLSDAIPLHMDALTGFKLHWHTSEHANEARSACRLTESPYHVGPDILAAHHRMLACGSSPFASRPCCRASLTERTAEDRNTRITAAFLFITDAVHRVDEETIELLESVSKAQPLCP